ncbi:MAG: hypothetical protein AAF483_12115, partial [Planctomycetota bacterium]
MQRPTGVRWQVRVSDTAMGLLVAVGGVSTIIALLLVVAVLLWTTLALLKPSRIGSWSQVDVPGYWVSSVDESGQLYWGVTKRGKVELWALADSGEPLHVIEAPDFFATPTCFALSEDRDLLVVGCEDGSVVSGRIKLEDEFVSMQDAPVDLALAGNRKVSIHDGKIFVKFEDSGLRKIGLDDWTWSAPQKVASGRICAIDIEQMEPSILLGVEESTRVLTLCQVESGDFELAMTTLDATQGGLPSFSEEKADLRLNIRGHGRAEDFVHCSLLPDSAQILVAWQSGTIDRYSIGLDSLQYQESQSTGTALVSASALSGRQAILCGTTDGRLIGWTVAKRNALETADPSFGRIEDELLANDPFQLVLHHELKISDSPIHSVASSSNSKTVAALDRAGKLQLAYVTTDSLLADSRVPTDEVGGNCELSFSSNNSELLLVSEEGTWVCPLELEHPDASTEAYFSTTWYEGYDRPNYIWQSSAGSDYSETKLSLIPLFFGTLKATIFTMLFSVPLAIFAAIYTSEFMGPVLRSRIRPLLELMASLPAVVIGYLFA